MSEHTQPDSGIERRATLSALLIGTAAAFTLAGYEFVRSVSNSAFVDSYGAGNLPFVMALGPVATILFVWAYGRALSALGARRALVATTLASAVAILTIYAALVGGYRPAAAALYVFREAYIVLLIEQYWSFINSTLNVRLAGRLNGPICGLASVGAISGGVLVSKLAVPLGTAQLLPIAAAGLLPAALLSICAYRVGGEPHAPETAGTGSLGLDTFRTHRPLRWIAVVILLTQVVAAVLDLAFNHAVADAFPGRDARTAYYGGFFAVLNGAAFVLQFFVAPALLRAVSLRSVHIGIPVLHVAGAVVLLANPTLTVAAAVFLLFKAVDYSIFRAGKEMLYIPMTYDARFRAKEVIDAFGYRAGKGMTSAAIAGLGLAGLPLSGAGFPLAAAAACAAWIGAAGRMTGRSGEREAGPSSDPAEAQ